MLNEILFLPSIVSELFLYFEKVDTKSSIHGSVAKIQDSLF